MSAVVTLSVAADREGIARVLYLEDFARRSLPGVRDTIPAYNRLLIEGSPDTWDPDAVEARLREGIRECLRVDPHVPTADTVVLPACYHPTLGPDLASTARRIGGSVEQVAALHTDRTYLVLATGFAPGWAYLGDTDPALATPRRPTPRQRVPAGSVAIADQRTGVYPTTGPGGWRLLGRVPRSYFDDVVERVGRFRVGGAVRFRPISLRDYEAE